MCDLEKIYLDKTAWIYFTGESGETIGVYCKCPECGRYVKHGKLLINRFGNIKLQGFICKIHGEIQPYFDRDC